MMVKDRFIKAYGLPDFTFSRVLRVGQQIPIADDIPGILDGIIPSRTFPTVPTNLQNTMIQKVANALFRQSRRQRRTTASDYWAREGSATLPRTMTGASDRGKIARREAVVVAAVRSCQEPVVLAVSIMTSTSMAYFCKPEHWTTPACSTACWRQR